MKFKKLKNYNTFLIQKDYSISIIPRVFYFNNFIIVKDIVLKKTK